MSILFVLVVIIGLIFCLFISGKESPRENDSIDLTKEHLLDAEPNNFFEFDYDGMLENSTPVEQKIPPDPYALSGKCGNSVTWRLINNHHLILEGSGETWDYSIYSEKDYRRWPTWKHHADKIRKITIGNGITCLGIAIFHDLKNLTEVNFSGRIRSIPSQTFLGCSGLISIQIPEGVTSIGSCAFGKCYSLRNIRLPQSLLEIEDSAFYSCTSLTSIDLPYSLEELSYDAFSDCPNMKQLTIPITTNVDLDSLMKLSSIQKVSRK